MRAPQAVEPAQAESNVGAAKRLLATKKKQQDEEKERAAKKKRAAIVKEAEDRTNKLEAPGEGGGAGSRTLPSHQGGCNCRSSLPMSPIYIRKCWTKSAPRGRNTRWPAISPVGMQAWTFGND